MNFNMNNEKGFSLLEIILVLGIITALIVSAFIVYPKIQSSQRANTEIKNIATIMAGINGLYAGMTRYVGLNNQTLINANIIPDNMLSSEEGVNNKITSSWGGDVNISLANQINDDGIIISSVKISYSSVPALECQKIIISSQSLFNLIYAGANGSLIIKNSIRDKTDSEASVNSIVSSCNSGGNNNTINMTTFGK